MRSGLNNVVDFWNRRCAGRGSGKYMGKNQEKSAYEGGATRTKLEERYDLIPHAALAALARRLAVGAERHGENNWKKGGADFIKATKNHLARHLALYLDGDRADAHLDAVICNVAFLCYFEEKNSSTLPPNCS